MNTIFFFIHTHTHTHTSPLHTTAAFGGARPLPPPPRQPPRHGPVSHITSRGAGSPNGGHERGPRMGATNGGMYGVDCTYSTCDTLPHPTIIPARPLAIYRPLCHNTQWTSLATGATRRSRGKSPHTTEHAMHKSLLAGSQ